MVGKVAALSLAVAAQAHYGDPYDKGCLKDETAIQVNGVAGAFCSPECTTTCPTDVPTGVTATPQCAITGNNVKYCALICTPTGDDAQCGTNASCKPIQSTGLCTYDDVPPPPSTNHWAAINSPDLQAVTEAIGIGFAPDGKTGFMGVGENGVGSLVLKTENAGVNWAQVYPNSTAPKFNLFLAAVAKSPTEAVVTGVACQVYTTDGKEFDCSKDDYLEPSQDAGLVPDGRFAIVNSGGKTNGVALSKSGQVWTNQEINVLNSTIYPARYGSYPTTTTWYVTAGSFPTSNTNKNILPRTSKFGLDKKTGGMRITADSMTSEATADPVPCSQDPTNCFSAAVLKTTDGGDTWKTVFQNDKDNIYPNGINCIDEKNCVFVMEGDTCRITVTADGGQTWTETQNDADPACSLTYVHMISTSEVWVSGGHLTALDFEGRFWHSVDGAATWVKEALKGLYIFDLNIVSATAGFALGLDASGSGIGLLGYVPSGKTAEIAITQARL